MSCYRERRSGVRKRKSLRGCVVGPDLAGLNLILVRKGDEELAGITDDQQPRRLGPKRASNIRKLFSLEKEDDVRKFVVRRPIEPKEGKKGKGTTKAPKIQRLVTKQLLRKKRDARKTLRAKMVSSKARKAEYAKKVAEYKHAQKEHKAD